MSVTLLQKGKVVVPKDVSDYDRGRIMNMTAIEYIMEWFAARTPTSIGGQANIEPQGLKDRVLIIKAGTGSGKSTTIGPELYAYFVGKGLGAGRSIGVTQPRILTTISIPNKIAKIPSMKFLRFGENLGYQTGIFINKPIKGLIFMTIGVITHQITSMPSEDFMRKYSFIMLDECHERSIHLDSAMYKLKNFIKANSKNTLCPFLILASATFDTMKYAKYFECGSENIIEVMGQSKPIASIHPALSCSNMVVEAVKQIIKIHEENQHDYDSPYGRDIITFVSTNTKMRDILDAIQTYNNDLHTQSRDDFIVSIKLTSDTYKKQGIDYKNIYKPYESIKVFVGSERVVVHPVRRVVIATPVAETGVTIDSLKYCIDTGLVMSPEWNPIYGATVVAEKPITQNMAMQRKGRVGRTFPGIWHPLYTKRIFDSLIENTVPDIIKHIPDEIVLVIIIEHALPDWNGSVLVDTDQMKSFDMRNIDLLDPIPYDSLSNTLRKFYAIGMIDDNYRPTIKALCAMKFPHVNVEAICMILSGYAHHANILSLVTIAAFVAGGSDKLFGRKYKRQQIFSDDVRSIYKTRLFIGCDFIDYIFIYENIRELVKGAIGGDVHGEIIKWCDTNMINYSMLKNVFNIRDAIISSLVSIGLNPYRNIPGSSIGNELTYSMKQHMLNDFDAGVGEVKKIKQCILDGFRMNVATYNPIIKKYVNDVNNSHIDTDSDLLSSIGFDESVKQNQPIKVVYGQQVLRRMPGGPYKFHMVAVSILDGFLVIDDDFVVS